MKTTKMLLLVPAAVLAAACGRKDTAAADAGLQNDLALASQAMPYNPQQLTSPAEMGLQYNPNTGQYQRIPTAPVQAAPVVLELVLRFISFALRAFRFWTIPPSP